MIRYRLFFQHFRENSTAKKTQFLPFGQKLTAGAAFIKQNVEKKIRKWAKKLRFSLKTQHRGSLRLLKSAPQPLKKKSLD
jgi:hypothetical protein